MKAFKPKIITALKGYSASKLVSDLVAGVIVAIIALPLSIALAIASGVSPEKGLYTAIVAGFVIALLGGSSVNISGPTAAFATIVAGIVAAYGISGLALATVMAGIILVIMGICRFGSLIKYIPYTITTGFTAGIAVTIAIGQIKDFAGLTFPEGTPTVETMDKLAAVCKNISTVTWQALVVGGIALAILILWPKVSKKIPGSLIAVIVGVLTVKFVPFLGDVKTIGDLYTINSSLPPFSVPEISLESIKTLLPSALTIAILAAIESLLSCVVSDGMIGDRHDSNTELIAQGLGNVCSGLFGGIPATGAIARTAANVKNGGKTPVAGIVHALVLLAILVVLMPYAAWIPMPVIAAILFMVAYNMCGWRQFVKLCKKAPKSDILVLVATFVLTVVFDLVVAIEVGMVLAAFLFLRRMVEVGKIREWENAVGERGKLLPEATVVYEIDGPIFFAVTDKIRFKAENCRTLILRMTKVSALDASAMTGLEALIDSCAENNIRIIFSHVNEQPMKVMKKYGVVSRLGEQAFAPNIDVALEMAKA